MFKAVLGSFALGFMVLMLIGPLMDLVVDGAAGPGSPFEELLPTLVVLLGVFALSGIVIRVLGGR